MILSSVQFFLLYNTYELTNDHFLLAEKEVIRREYEYAIRNDMFMPGGQAILRGFLDRNMIVMERLYRLDRPAFDRLRQKICDSAFHALRKANNADSVLAVIGQKHHLVRNYEYAIIIHSVEIAFQHDRYVGFYSKDDKNELIDPALLSRDGMRIGGTLEKVNSRNLVMPVTVSWSADYTPRVAFSLHMDIRDRRTTILLRMMPAFLLSLFSILSVILLFFITFRNWLRQKQLSEMKSDFINGITHEFHTPLSAIIIAGRTMQNEQIISDREALLPLIKVVQRQSERLKTLIGQVLDITTHNQIVLSKEEYSVHRLLDEILPGYRLRLVDQHVQFSLHKVADKDRVKMDRQWFTTILLNIFDNAVKYNNSEKKSITVTTFNTRKSIKIAIWDNGIGMTDDVRKHVFEKFYRHVRSYNGSGKGLGLGLFYVRQAVDAHGWKISITSKKGGGSTFLISIPL
jgi:two-component system phosphate regulon sensor histidine kinase PhoR